MNRREPRIYVLPNLFTSGNLFCGFLAILQVFESNYYNAIGLILGACLCDLLDGRVARLTQQESPFGKEYDSIADIVSFGVAPAFLVWKLVLAGIDDRIGMVIAFIYLVCGAMRLARFNCIDEHTTDENSPYKGCFEGMPIPAAAGVISSLTLFLLSISPDTNQLGWMTKFLLPVLMLLLSYLMFSSIPYPSFKHFNWKARKPLNWMFAIILVMVFTVVWWKWMPAVFFLSYMSYGLLRPLLPRKLTEEIELVEENTSSKSVTVDAKQLAKDSDPEKTESVPPSPS